MKAVGLYQYLPIEDEQSLVDVEIDKPVATGKDVLVAVKSIAVNPVDTKVRAPNDRVEKSPRILGWDAAGDVIAVGDQVEHYQVGDQVYYAGDITRQGSYSEYQLVDERIIGHMPIGTDYANAAAIPLTGITAWEALFDRLGISSAGEDTGKTVLIIGGAGGVGSMAIQLASKVAKLNVVATASRDESRDWCLKLGASFIINHRHSLVKELALQDIQQVDYILCLNNTDQYWEVMAEIIAPQGGICSIVETNAPVELNLLKSKAATFSWEFMFTRSMYQTPDMIEQKKLLNAIAELINQDQLCTTVKEVLRPINAKNLRKAHAMIEQGSTIGKIVLTDWE